MTVKDRIKLFIKNKGLSQAKFEKAAGLSNGYVNGIKSAPGADKLQNIFDAFPDLNTSWLLTGEGEMLKEEDTRELQDAELAEASINYTEGVPYYDEDFMLGFSEIMATGRENPEYLIKMPGYEKATLWCNASGHSMEPEISNGDIIALKRIEDPSFLPFGDIYGIITTNGLRTIKRLGRSQRDGYYRLIPTNKEYDEQEIPVSKIAIVYRVMGAMKPF